MKIRAISVFSGLLVFFAAAVNAADIDISGYASFTGIIANAEDAVGNQTTYNNGLADENLKFNTDDSLIGIQFTTNVSKKIDMTLVLHADGGASNYNIEAQWAYATYSFNEDLSLRMGKYKGSFYMVSDYQDVGYAYPWVRPPLEVYSTNPIKALTGLNLVYQTNLGKLGLLTELYVGSGTHTANYLPSVIDNWPTTTPPSKGDTVSFETPNSKGFNISLTGDIGTFRIGYYLTDVNAASFGISDKSGSFLGAGFNIDWKDLVVYSEYIQRDTDPELAGAFPDQEAFYVTFGYRMGKTLPYITLAKLAEGKDASPTAQEQSSVAVGFRYEVSDSAAVKAEVLKVTPEDSGYGLFYTPIENGTIATVRLDLIF